MRRTGFSLTRELFVASPLSMIIDHSIPTLVEDPVVEDPAERSKRDPVYRAAFIAAVEEGLASAENEECIPLEELEKEFYSWLTE